MAYGFLLSHVCIFLVFSMIPLPTVNSSKIPKAWQDFVQSCITSFTSSSAKHCFSTVFYPSGGEHVGDPEAYRIPPVILWNPLVQTQCDLACPTCRSSLRTWRWNDGRSPHSMPRSIFSVQERVLLVSCVYLCGNNHQVIAHDAELLKSVRQAGVRIPFILFHKSGMTKELHNFVSSSIQAGLCIQDIESMLLNLYSSHHSSRAYLYYSQPTQTMDSNMQCNFPHFNPKKDSIGRMLIRRAFLRAFSECEDMYTQHMASHCGHWLSADHTFKVSANIGYWNNQKWVKLYNAVFIVMNEENNVLAWQLTRGTSIDTVQSLLTGLYERHQNAQQEIKGIIIDNCCTVKNKINAIFGSRVLIKLDLFHAIKRILEKIPRKGVTSKLREVRQVMIKDLRLCFRDKNDIGQTRKQPTPPSDKMEKNLHEFLKKWSSELLDDIKVLPDKAVTEISKVMKHVKLGCLSGIPPGIGTNRNENIHKRLRKWLKKDRIGVALAVALLATVFYKLNICDMKENGHEQRICSPVSQWFHTFLASGKCPSSEKFGIGNNVSHLSSFTDESESLNSISDNLDIEFGDENVSSCESDSEEEYENVTLQSQEIIINRASTMAHIASHSFSKVQRPLLANKHSWINAPSMLLLFSHTDCHGQSEYFESEKKLDEIVSNYGFERMSVPGNGDCCFTSVSLGLDKLLEGNDDALIQHWESLQVHRNQDPSARNILLRELVVAEWLGDNSEEYAAFLTTSEKSSFEETARTFLEPGVFDCELGNSVLLSLSNVLKVPIVVSSSIDSYPVIPLVPRSSPLTVVPIYVAFNQSGKGHYDPVFAAKTQPCQEIEKTNQNTIKSQCCSCGRGGAKDKERLFCSTYGSRCKCFQHLQGCKPSCKCFNCGNPYGTKDLSVNDRQIRKRRKHDDLPLTSIEYLERKNEPMAPEQLEDFEIFVLQQLLSGIFMQYDDIDAPDYESIFMHFKEILTTAGFVNIPSFEKVKKLVDRIKRERGLFSLMLKQEVKKSWHKS